MRKHPLAECERCPLREDGRFVPSVGPEKATLAVVGEAPGFQEASYGQPFVGPSGKLLNVVLRGTGHRRADTFLTNATLCRPEDNATPPKEAISACKPRLIAELADRDPETIIALGNVATQVLLGTSVGITQLRIGPPKKMELAGKTVKIIPTFHPAYCLRSADNFPSMVTDFQKMKESNREPWHQPDWRAYDDPADSLGVISALSERTDRLVVDIEVGIEKDFAFGHPNQYDMLCVGLAYQRGKAVVIGGRALEDRRVWDALTALLRSKRLIAHNGKFDLAGLYPHTGALELYFDTMLASYCLDERPGQHGLKMNAVERLGAPQYDLEIKKYVPRNGNYANIPRPLLYQYNAYDVACTWDLMELFEKRLEDEGLREVHDFLVAASNQLMYLELNGITIDRNYSDQLTTSYIDKLEGTVARLAEVVGDDTFNPNSPKQVKTFLHDSGIRVESTNKDILAQLLRGRVAPGSDTAHFLSLLLDHRRKQKLYSTYVKGIRARLYRGRVYTTYLLHGTTSGRLASRNPNLQNIVRDKEVRGQFAVSKPGNVLVHGDYKQAEGRILAWLAQDEYLREKFSDPNVDLFSELSDDLYGPGNWAKEERVKTKAYFYGIGYGREAYSIAMDYNIPVREAERGYAAFLKLIPGVVQWQSDVRRKVLRGEDLISPLGRHRRFWLITDQNKKDVMNEALSFLPQSTVSDICLAALVCLRPMLRGMAFIRLTIHDALVVECAEADRLRVQSLMEEVMIEEAEKITTYVPFTVDFTYGKNWGEL